MRCSVTFLSLIHPSSYFLVICFTPHFPATSVKNKVLIPHFKNENGKKEASNTVSAKRHRSESRMRFLCDELITVEGTYGAKANSNVLFFHHRTQVEPKSRRSAIFADG